MDTSKKSIGSTGSNIGVFPWKARALLNKEDGGGGSGGGGSGGGGTPSITLEEVNRIAHAAIKERLSRFEESFGKVLDTKLAAVIEKMAPPPGDDAPPKDGSGKEKGKATSPEVAELTKNLKAMQEKLDKAERERQAAEDKRIAQENTATLSTALTKAGVRPELLDLAVTKYAAQLVRDDDGNVMWKSDTGPVTVEAGLSDVLKTATGKALLPPVKGAGGAGSGRAGNDAGGGKPAMMDDAGLTAFLSSGGVGNVG